MKYIKKNFMLSNDVAKSLYHDIAKDLPIIDYHCHLTAEGIYKDEVFDSITQVWIGGDHYKWRLMRAMGVDESCVTGDASDEDKFKAFAYTLENAVANPIFHWSHLELSKYFDFKELLREDNYKEVFEHCNNLIKEKQLSPRKMIVDSNVEFVCTTDDPADDLKYHELMLNEDFSAKVVPGFRPDRLYSVEKEVFNKFIEDMRNITGKELNSYDNLVDRLEERIIRFKELGSNVSDHGFNELVYRECSYEEASEIFSRMLNSEDISKEEHEKYQSRVMVDLGKLYKKHGFVIQIHFGAIRNNNSLIFKSLGRDVGVDSISDQTNLASALNGLLNALLENDALVKTIIYNLNPMYNDLIATTIANFQAYTHMRSKIQFGAAWWVNDTKRGMLNQLEALSDNGLIMNFVGMLTDSRSYLSYTRHDYFRRILCDFIGRRVLEGDIPQDDKLLRKLVENISYKNAKEYFEIGG